MGEGWQRPQRPHQSLIHELHRTGHDPEAGVTFAVKGERDGWKGLCTIPSQSLDNWFPAFIEQLEADSYFSANAPYIPRDPRTGKTRPSRNPARFNAPRAVQGEDKLRYLNCCYVDLDIYNKAGLSPEVAFVRVLQLAADGAIPEPSIYLDSGRGLWPIWELRDNREPSQSVRAVPSTVAKFRSINRALAERLLDLGADRQAIDAARFLRVPGSLNVKGKRKVGFLVKYDLEGKPIRYTLDELERFLGIKAPNIHPALRALGDSDPNQQRPQNRGHLGRCTKDLSRMELLRRLRARPVFEKGQRRKAVWAMASLLVLVRRGALRALKDGAELALEQRNAADMDDRAILDHLLSMREEFASVVSKDSEGKAVEDKGPNRKQIEATLKAVLAKCKRGKLSWKMTHSEFAQVFQITRDEAAQLGTSNGKPFPYFEGEAVVEPRAELSRDELAAMRREHLSKFVQGGTVESLRELSSRLAEVGLHASPVTVRSDLDALGVTNPRTRGSRQKQKLQSEAPLFASETSL